MEIHLSNKSGLNLCGSGHIVDSSQMLAPFPSASFASRNCMWLRWTSMLPFAEGNKSMTFKMVFILYWSTVALPCCVSFRVHQNDSAVYIHTSTLFQILPPFRLLQNTD